MKNKNHNFLKSQNNLNKIKMLTQKANAARHKKEKLNKQFAGIMEKSKNITESKKLLAEDLIPGKEYFIWSGPNRDRFLKITKRKNFLAAEFLGNEQTQKAYLPNQDGTISFAINASLYFTEIPSENE